MVAGRAELIRIAVAWRNSEVDRARRLTMLRSQSKAETWSWLWGNTRYDKAQLLARIPNANARTEKNIDALIANRVLYPMERFIRLSKGTWVKWSSSCFQVFSADNRDSSVADSFQNEFVVP